ncbi:MAG TPA: hypothetical protein VIH27_02275 [Nitrososphaerales archaeon]
MYKILLSGGEKNASFRVPRVRDKVFVDVTGNIMEKFTIMFTGSIAEIKLDSDRIRG